MSIKPEFTPKPIRSFVLRTGRMTDGQTHALEAHWARFGLEMASGEDPLQAFSQPTQPLVIEIGFGMGDSLLTMAKAAPTQNFLGIEVHPPGVGRLLQGAAEADLQNLKVYMADATDVLGSRIAPSSVERIQIFFPDPWHKKRHHKRRLIQPAFVAVLSRALRPGGTLHLATDWQPYAEVMLEVLNEAPELSNTAADYCPRPEYRPVTKFERRGERLGHGVWDIIFTKTA